MLMIIYNIINYRPLLVCFGVLLMEPTTNNTDTTWDRTPPPPAGIAAQGGWTFLRFRPPIYLTALLLCCAVACFAGCPPPMTQTARC